MWMRGHLKKCGMGHDRLLKNILKIVDGAIISGFSVVYQCLVFFIQNN